MTYTKSIKRFMPVRPNDLEVVKATYTKSI